MSAATSNEIIKRAWKLVVEQGHSRVSAARLMGITESRVNRIISAVHSRRKRNTLQSKKGTQTALPKRRLPLDEVAIAGGL